MLIATIDATNRSGMLLFFLILALLAVALYFLPSFVAFGRGHHYRWVIFAINLIFGATGIGYFIALIWSCWPKNTAIADVVRNDPITNSFESNTIIYAKQGANRLSQDQAAKATMVYVMKNGVQHGPYPHTILNIYLKNGYFSHHDLFWYQGLENWVPINQMASFIALPPNC